MLSDKALFSAAMLRLACAFACLAVTLGRRHTEHIDPVQPDMETVKQDVEQVEKRSKPGP